MKKTLVYALALSFLWPVAGGAQDSGGSGGWSSGFWSATIPAVAGSDALALALRKRMDERRSSPQPRRSASRPRDAEPPTLADVYYSASPERRIRNFAFFVEKSRAADSKGGDRLAQLFAQGDVIEQMQPKLAKHDLRIESIADAYTMWWISAWQASRGLSGDASDGATSSVRQQVIEAMAETPPLVNAGDTARQEMAESLLVQGLLLSTAVEQAKGNPAQLEGISHAAVESGKSMGLDMSSMVLTEKGFASSN